MNIEVVRAMPEHEPLFMSLWGLFLHDISEFTDGSWMGDDGEWQPPWGHWHVSARREDTGKPEPVENMLVRVDGRPAGYACIAFAPRVFVSPGREIAMSQFFVLKGYRRQGVGRRFACALFDRYPGKWEVGYYEQNIPANRFWNTIVADYTGGNFTPAPVYTEPDTDPLPGLNFASTGGKTHE